MSGILEIKRIEDNFIKYLSYLTLNRLKTEQKKDIMKDIYNQYRYKKIILSCTCKSKPVKMTIGYIAKTDTYFFRRFPNETHDSDCHFHKNNVISSDSIHENGWMNDAEGNYHVNLDPHDYRIKKQKNSSTPSSVTGVYDTGEISTSKSKASINQVVKMLVTTAWNTYIKFDLKQGYPNMSKIFNKVYQSTSKKFFITKDIAFHQALFKKGKLGALYYLEEKLKKKTQPFILLLLRKIEDGLDEKIYIITASNPVTDEIYQFTAPSDMVEFAKRSVIVPKGPFIVSGFVKTTGYGNIPEFLSMSLIPINNYGVPIESSYERETFDYLCENKRIVERPIESKYYPKFDGLLPDGLLLDTQPYTIIEIFGVSESNKEYHIHREFKICNMFDNFKIVTI